MKKMIKTMEQLKLRCLIWDFDDCPLEEKYACGHGGDEDYVLLIRKNDLQMESVVEAVCNAITKRLEVCDSHTKEYGKYILVVTAHA